MLLSSLVRHTPLRPLDSRRQGGADDIKKHKWFADINWDDMLAKKIAPPIKPEVGSASDTQNFECAAASQPCPCARGQAESEASGVAP